MDNTKRAQPAASELDFPCRSVMHALILPCFVYPVSADLGKRAGSALAQIRSTPNIILETPHHPCTALLRNRAVAIEFFLIVLVPRQTLDHDFSRLAQFSDFLP